MGGRSADESEGDEERTGADEERTGADEES